MSTKKKKHFLTPQQVGIDRYLDYFDIMLLGKTGVGKTTTADKILAANPSGRNYSEEAQEDTVVIATEPDNDTQTSEGGTDEGGASGSFRSATPARIPGTATQCHDLTMWHLLGDEKTVEDMTQRLKGLTLARCLEKPQEEITNLHQVSRSTEKCELLSNDTSHVRVLDVPGFYGPNAVCSQSRGASSGPPPHPEGSNSSTSVRERVQETTETDLSIMRKILHIKTAMKFKFNRIIYFLPETGVLTRCSQILRTEVAIMENYFGSSIFKCMVVAATYNRGAYAKFARGIDLYTQEDKTTTRRHFQEALRDVLKVDKSSSIPEPPIIFLSLWDTCEDILRKIQESDVGSEGVNLSFNPSTCARCGIKIGRLKEDAHKRPKKRTTAGGGKEMMEESSDVVAVAAREGMSWSSAIPYEETTCHPMLIPKYTKVEKILGGIVHLITFKAFEGRWPGFSNIDEVCIECKESPKAVGCTKVGTTYTCKGSEGILVDHTSVVQEDFIIELDPKDEMGQSVKDQCSVVVGGKLFLAKNAAYMAED